MSKIQKYPLARSDAEVYFPVFNNESWGNTYDHPLPNMAQIETVRSYIDHAYQYKQGVKINCLGEFGDNDVVRSIDLEPGTLLKSTYEALLVNKSRDAIFDPAVGKFTASELSLGYSVQYEAKGITMEYVQRTLGHIVLKNKSMRNVLTTVLPILDFTDGSLVDDGVLDTTPSFSFRMHRYPALLMGPTTTHGWQLNAVYGGVNSKIRRITEQKMRVAKTEIFNPIRRGGNSRRKNKNVRKSETPTPVWLHA